MKKVQLPFQVKTKRDPSIITIRDLMDGDATHYTGWTINITEGKRAVSSLPFKLSAGRN